MTKRVLPPPPDAPTIRKTPARIALMCLSLILACSLSAQDMDPATLERQFGVPFHASHLSGVPYRSLLSAYGVFGPDAETVQGAGPVPSGTVAATNDVQQDVEPAVIATTISGVVKTTVVNVKYIPVVGSFVNLNYFANTGANGESNFTYRGALPMPNGYIESADPLLAQNPNGTGQGPHRMYCVGILYNGFSGSGNGPPIAPNGIAVWPSTDGGQTWQLPNLAVVTNDQSVFYDKPSIAVSTAASSNGYVYAAYMSYPQPWGNNNSVSVAKSTDGGVTFSRSLVATGNLGGPLVSVTGTGAIVVVFADYTAGKLRVATSTTGTSWAIFDGPTGSFVTPASPGITGGLRALTFPMARFNPITGQVAVVWHERGVGSGVGTEVYYTSCSTTSCLAKVRVNQVTTKDQFMPAIDPSTIDGNLIVTYYDRRDDPMGILYTTRYDYISPSGANLQGGQDFVTITGSTIYSDPNKEPHSANFIGDYQDVRFWPTAQSLGLGPHWSTPFAVCSGNFNINSDIYATVLQ
jgi:hypothetical protein